MTERKKTFLKYDVILSRMQRRNILSSIELNVLLYLEQYSAAQKKSENFLDSAPLVVERCNGTTAGLGLLEIELG